VGEEGNGGGRGKRGREKGAGLVAAGITRDKRTWNLFRHDII